MDKNKVLVAIPIFNEVDVYTLVKKVKHFSPDIVVIDDGSTDRSFHKELKHIEGVRLITHTRNLGYGKTIMDAFGFAVMNGYEYIITIDGDGQHEPEEILLFLNEIPFADCDILSGSRYFFPLRIGQEVPPDRYFINQEITRIVNRITHFHITDAFCGFKSYKVEGLKLLRLTEYGYGMPLQLWLQAWKAGLRVKEIPVKLIYKDPAKQFRGILEDPDIRLRYYKDIIKRELAYTQQIRTVQRKTKSKTCFKITS
ncbi:MAG: glycosyltransferase family 2 protein [wastewater metagenome]|nr:glycosyltransferase family 2 protein [Candidatus Loosdrechtia aerotolerans]